jgi:hypothetical protein
MKLIVKIRFMSGIAFLILLLSLPLTGINEVYVEASINKQNFSGTNLNQNKYKHEDFIS